ncbi:hypothetical protein MnTg02_03381 [bacterium MnTg02]|nr:hypothetical protein MnTg02_03381 [bacterium MnTg02]
MQPVFDIFCPLGKFGGLLLHGADRLFCLLQTVSQTLQQCAQTLFRTRRVKSFFEFGKTLGDFGAAQFADITGGRDPAKLSGNSENHDTARQSSGDMGYQTGGSHQPAVFLR